MRYVKWAFYALVALFVVAFLHYTLPQRDVVRIVSTYPKAQELGMNRIFWSNPGQTSEGTINQDVLFISTVMANGKPMEYRNEDTGWWPPYLKFDTARLQTEAEDAKSTKDNPQWVAITHYGWRSTFLSAFPNAISIKPVSGPDVTFVPWFNIIFLVALVAVFRTIQVRLRRLWRRWFGEPEET